MAYKRKNKDFDAKLAARADAIRRELDRAASIQFRCEYEEPRPSIFSILRRAKDFLRRRLEDRKCPSCGGTGQYRDSKKNVR